MEVIGVSVKLQGSGSLLFPWPALLMFKAKSDLKGQLVQYSHFASEDHVPPEVNALPRVIRPVNVKVHQRAATLTGSPVPFSPQYVLSSVREGKVNTRGHIPCQGFAQRVGPFAGREGWRVMNYQLSLSYFFLRILPGTLHHLQVCLGLAVALFANFMISVFSFWSRVDIWGIFVVARIFFFFNSDFVWTVVFCLSSPSFLSFFFLRCSVRSHCSNSAGIYHFPHTQPCLC